MNYVVEGIDRLGKDILINHIILNEGYYNVVHCTKPPKVNLYGSENEFQRNSFVSLMSLLKICDGNNKMIFNRSWLGEYVYSNYRNYSGEYIFEIENYLSVDNLEDTLLILLYTDNTEMLIDDGLSIDYSNRQIEQQLFIEAYEKSIMKNKIMVNVHNGKGGYRNIDDIYSEVRRFKLWI